MGVLFCGSTSLNAAKAEDNAGTYLTVHHHNESVACSQRQQFCRTSSYQSSAFFPAEVLFHF